MNQAVERIKNGLVTENPTFVQILGMCPTLAVTTSAINGIGMGLSTTVILIMSNLMIAALRNVIPNRVRIPAYIVIVASFVTIVDFLLQAYLPGLSESLGSYIKLIVVNCIILGRAEAYASKNKVLPSVFDGLGMGLGFTVGLTSIGIVREILGAGTIFGVTIPYYKPIGIFVLAPGAFIVLAFLIAVLNAGRLRKAKAEGTEAKLCRTEDCLHCSNASCGGRFIDFEAPEGVIGQTTVKKPEKKVEEKKEEGKKKIEENKPDEKKEKEEKTTGSEEEKIEEKRVIKEDIIEQAEEEKETTEKNEEQEVRTDE
ncbi:MAG: electron transport complex subunit E [Lachnospiraceae bacterium]|nr:electron transport complex subunit E [Lachnospiraceae bacterium]